MSGSVSMILGPHRFEAVGDSFQDVQRRTQTPWADIPVAQTLNQQQFTGPTAEEITIRGVLFPVEFPASLAGLIAAANAGTPLMFVSGDATLGTIHGVFTIQGVDEDRGFHDRAGRPWRNAYTLTLKRYGQRLPTGGGLGALVSIFQ